MRVHEPGRFFATAARGTEGVLRDELRALGLPSVRAERGGVAFGRAFDDGMRACLHSRIAVRVLERVATFQARDAGMLYAAIGRVGIERVLDPSRTFAVRATVHGNEALRHTMFAAQKVKDGLVDRLRRRFGARPNVDRDDPDVLVTVLVQGERGQLLLDLSGTPLHRRGYRSQAREAPLKETLAAAVLRFAGWDRRVPLLDPMCGSGTFAIEAAQWSANIAPGLRRSFGFTRWRDFDDVRQRAWQAMCEEARAQVVPQATVWATDRDPDAITLTRKNAVAAGVEVHTRQADIGEMTPLSPPGFVVLNPPYGVRIARDQDFHRPLGTAMRRLEGHRIAILTTDMRLPQTLRLRPTLEHTLYNGALECRLFVWDIR